MTPKKLFSPSIYYDPEITLFSNPFLRGICVISTFCYIFLMFLMLKKSEKLQKFKWLLIFYMTSSYIFNMVEVFFQVTPLFPAIALTFDPLFHLEAPWLATLGLFCYAFSIHLVIVSLVAQIIYKFIKIHPNFEFKYSKFRYAIWIYFFITEILISGITGYLVSLSVNPYYLELQNEIIYKTAPKLSEFVGNSLLIVFATDLSYCFRILGFFLTLYILFAILAIVYLRIKINNRRKAMSWKTLKMLNLIFYLMITEIICAIILLGIPGVLAFLHAGYEISYPYPISSVCILIISTHFIGASIAMIFTIKPYRKFVSSLFLNFNANTCKVTIHKR